MKWCSDAAEFVIVASGALRYADVLSVALGKREPGEVCVPFYVALAKTLGLSLMFLEPRALDC